MLRHPDASSSIEDFSSSGFQRVRPDRQVTAARRILLCSGKIGHELRMERTRKKSTGIAITFVDQLYPFPEAELAAELERHPNAREIVWVQEEPANMGALNYMLPRLRHLAGERPVLSVKRSASPSPATGSAKAHDVEQKVLLSLALTSNGH
jgi:2-oxoglutarate dehydrogenase E1 component